MKEVLVEIKVFLADFFINFWGAITRFDLGFSNADALGKVVIMVGGYSLSVYHFMRHRKAELEEAGFNVFVFDPGVMVNKRVDDLAQKLGKFVEKVRARTGAEQVAIVAHSMGGVIAQYYLEKCNGDDRVEKIITTGTPFYGTRVAFLAPHTKAARQMIPKSKFLLELQENPQYSGRIVSIRAKRDQIIKPKSSSILKGAKNIEVSVIGHNSLMRATEVLEIIKKELR